MAKRGRKPKSTSTGNSTEVKEYRHPVSRKNVPPAGLVSQGRIPAAPKVEYAYNPHLPPILRFDPTGRADQLPVLLQSARERKLSTEEVQTLADALRNREPWLEWSGKREKKTVEVDPVALNIHERISARAILNVAARKDAVRDMFADPEQDYRDAVQFYQHEMDWANRLILGDSLEVMASLARREGLAGKVQMIYMDPPYGIKYASNFQPEVGKRDVKDKEQDLTREPEQVKAYRDTWTLGVHSYLNYLRDRLALCKELLTDSGSIFVQISDENLHRVRTLMDEVFGTEHFVSVIAFQKTGSFSSSSLDNVLDFVVCYAKQKESLKFRPLFGTKDSAKSGVKNYQSLELETGVTRPLSRQELKDPSMIMAGLRNYGLHAITSSGSANDPQPFNFNGVMWAPKKNEHWKAQYPIGMTRLAAAGRIEATSKRVGYKRYFDDFTSVPISNIWDDTRGEMDIIYVVQTSTRIIERCLLMTTDPGDLVFDPTCGSGTTAYVAEQWGRRWITTDTSRVAVSLARQRILTAAFPYYKLRPVNANDMEKNPKGTWLRNGGHERLTFNYKTVPHVTLKSIARNVALDPIFARHEPILKAALDAANLALAKALKADEDLRRRLAGKLESKQKSEGKKSISDADKRRWLLPPDNRKDRKYDTVPMNFAGWYEWEMPFDADPIWPKPLADAVINYRKAWRAKMDEVNACIAEHADQEELVDQPEKDNSRARVSGPFTVESVLPLEESLAGPEHESPIAGAPETLPTFSDAPERASAADTDAIVENSAHDAQGAESYLDTMLRLLRADGVHFLNNKRTTFTRLEAIRGGFLHAEGEWESENGTQRVAVCVGPQHGPVTAWQVENALHEASRAYDALVFAGFSFDGEAQAIIQTDPNPRVRCHLAHIRPDASPAMRGLLKDSPNSQIFTVFGSPRSKLDKLKDGQYRITMEGIDIYDPVNNVLRPTKADKVAAWFVDGDYDGRCFCVTQAFFPNRDAWQKLARVLKGVVDEERFEDLSGTISLPFPAGKHKRAAIKVIDPRGNEAMAIHRLNGKRS